MASEPDEDRSVIFYHGTTVPRAQSICGNQAFAPTDTYLTSAANRDLAQFFAHRTSSRDGGPPAVVRVSIEEATISFLRQNKLMKLIRFDDGDRPELRDRSQWIISRGAVETLNRGLVEASWEPV